MQIKTDRKDGASFKEIGVDVPFDAKAMSDGGVFEGFASTFGNVDLGGDVVMPGAFTDSLVKRPFAKIKMLHGHDRDKIAGKWLEMRETDKGLYVKGQLFLELPRGKELHLWMKEGQLEGLSIGFRTIVDEYDKELGIRRLKKVDLQEVSVVTFPMNELAVVYNVKTFDETLANIKTIKDLEKMVREASVFSRKQVTALTSVMKRIVRREAETDQSDESGSILAQMAAVMRG